MANAEPDSEALQSQVAKSAFVNYVKTNIQRSGWKDGEVLSPDNAAKFLIAIPQWVEAYLEKACAKHGRCFLIASLNEFQQVHYSGIEFDGDNLEIFALSCLAALKFGVPDKSALYHLCDVDDYNNLMRDEKRWAKATCSIITALHVGMIILKDCEAARRCIEKGGRLKVTFQYSPPFKVDLDKSVKQAIDFFEHRLVTEANLLLYEGFYLPLQKDPSNRFTFPLRQFDWEKMMQTAKGALILTDVALLPLYATYLRLSDEVAAKFRYKIFLEDVFAFIHALGVACTELSSNKEVPTAFLMGSKTYFTNLIANLAPRSYTALQNAAADAGIYLPIIFESYSSGYWVNNAGRVFRAFSYSYRNAKKISLSTNNLNKFIFKVNQNQLVVSYPLALYFFRNRLIPNPKKGDFLNAKGNFFELQTFKNVLDVPGIERVWARRTKVSGSIGRKMGTDVDVLVGKEDYLFLVSCRAYYVRDQYRSGAQREVWDRGEMIRGWLSEVDELAKHLADNLQKPSLPPKFKYIVPIVCTTFPEFLYELSSHTLLVDNVPRICTLNELILFLSNLGPYLPELKTRAFVQSIK